MSRLFGDAPANRTAAWQPPPNARGSISILWTCLITLTLCIWTAVHLNLPEHRPGPPRSKWDPRGWITRQQLRKAMWLILGLLAPEFIAFIAWAQRRDAHRLTKKMEEAFNTPSPEPDLYGAERREMDVEPTKREWTITHSFFATSGGFSFDTSDLSEDQKFLPGTRDRLSLTESGLKYVAQYAPWLIPHMSAEFIKDKSKANGLAKAIVCFQATWFMVEIIVRLIQGLPISLLELNTFAHALCALLIYVLWWDKPFDVEEPVLIQGKGMWRVCADLCEESFLDESSDTELHRARRALRRAHQTQTSSYRPFQRPGLRDRLSNTPVSVDFFDILSLYEHGRIARFEDVQFSIAFIVAGLVYGGLHLIAWVYPFPSATQQFMWKLSGITVAASGLAFVPLGVFLGFLVHWEPELVFGSKRIARVCVGIVDSPVILLVYLPFVGLYLFARGYLVVACFLTFPYLPPEVFNQPEWSYYFPHIS